MSKLFVNKLHVYIDKIWTYIMSLEAQKSRCELLVAAIYIVMSCRKGSTPFIARKLNIDYLQAVELMRAMEVMGIVGEANIVGKREVASLRKIPGNDTEQAGSSIIQASTPEDNHSISEEAVIDQTAAGKDDFEEFKRTVYELMNLDYDDDTSHQSDGVDDEMEAHLA